MNLFRRLWKRAGGRRGQTTSEYLLVISVLVIGIVAVTYTPMASAFRDGSSSYNQKVGKATAKGHFAGTDSEER